MSTNGVPEVLKKEGISAETVKALSAFKDEPGWLTERRFPVSQAGSSLNAESAFMVWALMPLLLRTSGTPLVLIYHPSLSS